jgi:cytochrome c biogenesis protein CcmG/thiol:disulfide interchange protein DsbE
MRASVSWPRLVPLAVFAVLAAVFAFALRTGDPSKLPSALIGKPAPRLQLAGLDGLVTDGRVVPGVDAAALATGRPVVVNFWASWCAPCVAEHPLLIRLVKETGVALIGINHKDTAINARRFLGRYGNPFAAVGVDGDGRAAIEWGVYGMPETFVLDGQGRIVYKHVGPISAASLAEKLIPAVKAAN